jgi:23S rRNA (cytidine1920-2'-O)/16S rRNA (cytidine1409-2'-O)-methyltransferase
LAKPLQRLDASLVAAGLFSDLITAQAVIMAGRVRVNGQRQDKPGFSVKNGQELEVAGLEHPYVGRGGMKLEAALDCFGIRVEGSHCLDIGASTGGFTDCLLARGAAKVTAVDVGYGQLHPKLRQDPRVRCLERTDARLLKADGFAEVPVFFCMDVSFISACVLLPQLLPLVSPGGKAVVLVKPQFELPLHRVPSGGVVLDRMDQLEACAQVRLCAEAHGAQVLGAMPSPVLGAAGNQEFLISLLRGD